MGVSMNSMLFHIRKKGQGQSLLEFALILPVLVLVLVGVFDLGRALFALITINNAAREGARYATLHTDEAVAMIQAAAVQEAAGSGVDITAANVSVVCLEDSGGPAWPCDRGNAVRVWVSNTFEPILGIFIPTITMQRYVEMDIP
jgi:Flp pilus assembly protein TadG